jgi:hypothetical protein
MTEVEASSKRMPPVRSASTKKHHVDAAESSAVGFYSK